MTENEIIEILDDIWTFGHEPTDEERISANKAIDLIQELQQYRKIGTVEECREAREKQKGKKPTLYGDFEDGKLLCPNCEEDLMDLAECGFNCCPYCGQAIDWSDTP